MKRIPSGSALILLGLVCLLSVSWVAGSLAQEDDDRARIAAKALEKAVEKGKALFHDKSLGTKPKMCATCHENPERPSLNLRARVVDYPKWDKREGRVITLGTKVNQMIDRMLKGVGEELGSERLVAIEAYLMSIARDR